MYYLDGDCAHLWFGCNGLLQNMETYFINSNPSRRQSFFIHSYYLLGNFIRDENWPRIKRFTTANLPKNCKYIFDCGKIIISINESLHWTFYCIYVQEKVIAYYDSFNPKTQPHSFPVKYLHAWLKQESEELGIQFHE